MNKPQLIEEINKLPDNVEFLVSKDAEGNAFSPLEAFSLEYVDENDYDSGVIEEVFTEEDLREDSEDGEIPDNFRLVAVAWRR
jgi:hypothetical protein